MDVKICGLTDADNLRAAVDAGARYIGLNFVEKSPRYVTVERARALALDIPPAVCKVALVVDADDSRLDEITDQVPIDMLQLHGHEPPERVREIKARYGLPVMKVVGVAEASDLDEIAIYAPVADQLLIDTKPPKGADIPGGNGIAFDWQLLQGRRWSVPWMLAGGLTADNVAEAARVTGARQVDASSSLERERGVKDAGLIAAFLQAAQS